MMQLGNFFYNNKDMTGYGNSQVGVVTNGVNAELTEFSRKLITEYLKIGFVNRSLFGGSSDHGKNFF
jgi:hypothetical protein